jgi:hypothetical protein
MDQKEVVKNYNQRIAEGDIEIENTSCLCSAKDFVKVAEFDRYGF